MAATNTRTVEGIVSPKEEVEPALQSRGNTGKKGGNKGRLSLRTLLIVLPASWGNKSTGMFKRISERMSVKRKWD